MCFRVNHTIDIDTKTERYISYIDFYMTDIIIEIQSVEYLSFLKLIPFDTLIAWVVSISAKIITETYKQDKPYTFFYR